MHVSFSLSAPPRIICRHSELDCRPPIIASDEVSARNAPRNILRELNGLRKRCTPCVKFADGPVVDRNRQPLSPPAWAVRPCSPTDCCRGLIVLCETARLKP